MSAVCRIVVDDRERADGVPQALAELGVIVEVARLPSGDYALPNGVVVERKTIRGLHRSVVEGRFWKQLNELRAGCRAPYVLLEGVSLDAGALSARAALGVCLGVIGQGVPIMWSSDESHSAEWLRSLAIRAAGTQPVRDRPTYAQRPQPQRALVREAMLSAVPGISTKRARALLESFGTVAAVVSAADDEWMKVHGIGAVQAARLREAIS